MTETELNDYCNELILEFKKNKLGGFLVLVTDEGMASVTILPEWGILTTDFKEKTVSLTGLNEESIEKWLEKAEKTIYFLEAVKQSCSDSIEAFDSIQKVLNKTLEQLCETISNAENKVTVH